MILRSIYLHVYTRRKASLLYIYSHLNAQSDCVTCSLKGFQNHLMILKISKMTALTESPKPQKNV